MRSILLVSMLVAFGCAHGGNGRPDYCARPFSFDDPRLDLDHDGAVGGTDFAIYRHECGKG